MPAARLTHTCRVESVGLRPGACSGVGTWAGLTPGLPHLDPGLGSPAPPPTPASGMGAGKGRRWNTPPTHPHTAVGWWPRHTRTKANDSVTISLNQTPEVRQRHPGWAGGVPSLGTNDLRVRMAGPVH